MSDDGVFGMRAGHAGRVRRTAVLGTGNLVHLLDRVPPIGDGRRRYRLQVIVAVVIRGRYGRRQRRRRLQQAAVRANDMSDGTLRTWTLLLSVPPCLRLLRPFSLFVNWFRSSANSEWSLSTTSSSPCSEST